MPPLSAYTPFESLLFFQSLATSDARPASFASISNLLCDNPFVRQNGAFNADRLSPEALEDLYATLMRDGLDNADPNGRPAETSGPSNPKKRKISSPRSGGLADGATHATLVPQLVAHLYAKYRELVTREIRDEERRYTEIKGELEHLQKQAPEPAAIETSALQAAKAKHAPEPMDIDVKEETPRQVDKTLDETVLHDRQAQTGQQKPVVAAPEPQQPPSQPVGPATDGQNRPQLPIQPTIAPGPQQMAAVTPTVSTGAPAAHPSQAPPSIAAGKGGPAVATPTTSRAPAQSSFQQWQLEPSPSVSPKTATAQAVPATTKKPLLPPAAQPQAAIPSAVPATPGPTPVPVGQPVLHPRASQTPSAPGASFSESRGSRPRLSIDTPGSSTPWKRTPGLSIPQSPPSPVRPRPEDVSPISERAPSPVDEMDILSPRAIGGRSQPMKKPRRGQTTAAEDKAAAKIKIEKPSSAASRRRAASTASSRSRGLSVLSRDETPMPPEGIERESRATRRKGAAAAAPEDLLAKGRIKRKRGVSESFEQEPLPPETPTPKVDTSQHVLCTRNFHRTAAPIMNDVTTHKLASIFAKPLAERDAPGYHDLIYRPQDLKSIKSAIHQGSRAVNAATEAVNTPAGDVESPAPAGGTPSKSAGAVLMLPKTEDLLPPKGIVNSAQLEKEVIRMFANAIMFNPLPQRGFGPAFTMTTDRGSRESTQGDADEGGIIQDSLEMFEDVEQAVTRWRAAERTADELANKNVLSLRRGSVSDFNTDSADDTKG